MTINKPNTDSVKLATRTANMRVNEYLMFKYDCFTRKDEVDALINKISGSIEEVILAGRVDDLPEELRAIATIKEYKHTKGPRKGETFNDLVATTVSDFGKVEVELKLWFARKFTKEYNALRKARLDAGVNSEGKTVKNYQLVLDARADFDIMKEHAKNDKAARKQKLIELRQSLHEDMDKYTLDKELAKKATKLNKKVSVSTDENDKVTVKTTVTQE